MYDRKHSPYRPVRGRRHAGSGFPLRGRRMTAPRGLTALPLIVLTAACASAPPVGHPEIGVAVPAAWTAKTEAAPVQPVWWRQFGDPTLEKVVAEALEGNRDLRAAATRVEAAAALARITGADQFPVVNVSLDASRRKQNFIGLPIPGAEGEVLSTRATTYGVSLDTTWEADVWGRIRSGVSASLADAEATLFETGGARLSLAAQTAKAWFALIEARQQRRLAEDTVSSYRTTSEQVRDRYRRGLVPPVDLRLALSNLHAAQALLAERNEQYGRVLRQLELLLGRYPAGALQPPDVLPALPSEIPAGLPAGLLAQRPDLQAAERRLAAADARLVADRRALYPSFSLTGSGGTSTNALRNLLDGDFSVWSVVGSVAQPIFQGGRLRAQVEVADAQVREALELYAGQVLTAFSEVEIALDAQAHLRERAARLTDASEQAAAARTLAERRYGTGLDTILALLEAQRRQLDADSQLLTARRLQLDARVDLHLAVGGDFDAASLVSGGS
ncbi:MAG: efflux transporter outer membrane subunit [Luteitalea sp.]|nr:efflux transporter outer membrane subunit [Luteitalea sp.]